MRVNARTHVRIGLPSAGGLDQHTLKACLKVLFWAAVFLFLVISPAVLVCSSMRAYADGMRTGAYGLEAQNAAQQFENDTGMDSSWLFNAFCVQTWLGVERLLLPFLPPPSPPPTYVQYVPSPEQIGLRWSDSAWYVNSTTNQMELNSSVNVNVTVYLYVPDAGFRVLDWGIVERDGKNFTVDIKVERWTGEGMQVATRLDHTYELGWVEKSNYNFTTEKYDHYYFVITAWGEKVGTCEFYVDKYAYVQIHRHDFANVWSW